MDYPRGRLSGSSMPICVAHGLSGSWLVFTLLSVEVSSALVQQHIFTLLSMLE